MDIFGKTSDFSFINMMKIVMCFPFYNFVDKFLKMPLAEKRTMYKNKDFVTLADVPNYTKFGDAIKSKYRKLNI